MVPAEAKPPQRAKLKKQHKQAIDGLLAAAVEAFSGRRFVEAQFLCGQILTFVPGNFEALKLLGNSQLEAGQLTEAVGTLGQAIAVGPRSPDLLCNRGAALFRLGRFAEAREIFGAALALNANHLMALKNLGITLRRLNLHEEALTVYDRALRVAANDADIWYNRGATYFARERIGEAQDCCAKALQLRPNHVETQIAQAAVLIYRSRFSAARELLDGVVALNPHNHDALSHRSHVLLRLGDTEAALRDAEAALALAPPDGQYPALVALAVLARCHALAGESEQAIKLINRAIEIAPDDQAIISHRIFLLDFAATNFAEQQAARRLWWERTAKRCPRCTLNDVDTDPERRLRVGYVSADLRDHSAGLTVRPLLRCHDRSEVEVFAFNTSEISNAVTQEFRAMVDHWEDVAEIDDDHLAQRVMAQRIDILVDCSGHTAGNRLKVFARKPAPIQVTAWGNCTGTGIPLIDYLFSDWVSIPTEARPLHSEQIADLPCTIMIEAPGMPGSPLPMLRNGHVTFGVFNRADKLSHPTVALWSRIFAAIPNARLIIKSSNLDDPAVCGKLIERLASHGIPSERVALLGRSTRTQHLRMFDEVDISLDPFPQNGGVSTWESLHMGVPVIAKLGTSTSSRVGAAILTAVGLTDFVAPDDEAYLDIACRAVAAPHTLAELRAELPGRIVKTAAGDPVRYTREVERWYRRFWRDYCAADQSSKA